MGVHPRINPSPPWFDNGGSGKASCRSERTRTPSTPNRVGEVSQTGREAGKVEMLDENKLAEARTILATHIDNAVEELSEFDFGYWPDSTDALVDAVLNVLKHQCRINDYHKQNTPGF